MSSPSTASEDKIFSTVEAGVILAHYRELLGFGLRKCQKCGSDFLPPVYVVCKDVQCCELCSRTQIFEWFATDEGRAAVKNFSKPMSSNE